MPHLFLSVALALTVCCVSRAGAEEAPSSGLGGTQQAVLTLEEAATLLRVNAAAVEKLARAGSLPAREIAGAWRFNRAALLEWLRGDRYARAESRTAELPPAEAQPVPSGIPASSGALTLRASELASVVATGVAGTPAASAPDVAASRPDTQKKTIGEKPATRRADEIALRDQAALLPGGRTTLEFGLSYARAERLNFGLLRVEQNTATGNFAARYGLRDNLQLTARLPVHYRRTSTIPAPALGTTVRESDTYVGDVSMSLLGVAAQERIGRPNVIVSADIVLPTGPGDAGLGAGVVLSKSFDPVVLFAGASYLRGLGIDPDEPRSVLAKHNVGYNFGYAYAINDSVALSGVFTGTYRTGERNAGIGVLAPSRETYQLQFGATLQLARRLFIEPTVAIGVGGSAPDLTLSVNVPYTY